MANPFYNPSGNPATGAEGLSALMRGEFIAIGTAFDMMPRITTTGLFDTVFNQLGNFTFTLPGVSGTLATTANVAAETTRATAAEGANATAISAETTARTAAVTAETTARTAAVSAETTARMTAVSAETTRATAAEGVNATAISAETTARLAATLPLYNNVGRNQFHNGMDRVRQRNAGPFVVSSYVSDRWFFGTGTGGGSRSVSIAALSDAARTAIGDEGAAYALQYVFSGGSSTGDTDYLSQKLEGVRRTAGKSVTVSFWAVAAAGAPKIGVALQQYFGSGGSPSATVLIPAQAVTLSTAWTRYVVTFVVPTIVGKTLGTAGDDCLEADFWLSSGPTFNAQAGSIGVQAGTATLFGRQLEIGSLATALDKPDLGYEFATCQRFYQVGATSIQTYQSAGGASVSTAPFPVWMRAIPTMIPTWSNVNITSPSISATVDHLAILGSATATGPVALTALWTASADL
jgi:hypothetical protein